MKYTRLSRLFVLIIVISTILLGSNPAAAQSSPAEQKAEPANPVVVSGQQDIAMASASEGWIVGTGGMIKRYNNGIWSNYASPVTTTLYAVDATANDAWAAGDQVIHKVGNNWQIVTGYVTPTINYPQLAYRPFDDIKIVSNGDVWLLGTNYIAGPCCAAGEQKTDQPAQPLSCTNTQAGICPLLQRYSNGIWTTYDLGPLVVNAVEFDEMSWASPTEGWLIGNGNVGEHVIYHFNNGTLTREFQLTAQGNPSGLNIQMVSPTDGWATVEQKFYRYQNGTWSLVFNVPLCGADIHEVATSLLVFNSTYYYPCQRPAPLNNWVFLRNRMVQSPAFGTRINEMDGVSGTDIWLISDNNIYHWDGLQIASYPFSCTVSFGDVPANYWAYSYIHALACANIVSGTGGGNFSPDANATRVQFAKMISLTRGWQLINPAIASFSDVPTNHPLYPYVETAKAQGAITGYSGTTCTDRGVASPCYLPNDNISRAQTALIIVRAYNWPTNTTGGPHFTDVPNGTFFYNAVETAYNRGVVSGVGGGLFNPNANVTRAQISKMLFQSRQ